jgi:alkylation response protein AidB-like acyl-CoA dehydrogenase
MADLDPCYIGEHSRTVVPEARARGTRQARVGRTRDTLAMGNSFGLGPLTELLGDDRPRMVDPLLDAIAAQAEAADQTRTVDPGIITAIKANPVMVAAASAEIGGGAVSIVEIGRELEATAAGCTSTAWCLWNHLAVFHLFVGALGPEHTDLLTRIVENREWVSFPAGAGSGVKGVPDDDHLILNGPAAFGSGARYGDWLGVAVGVVGPDGRLGSPPDLRFSILHNREAGVSIDPTWDGLAVRASATDTVNYDDTRLPTASFVPWWGADRADKLRDPDLPVIHHRYREDWVGLSDVWLASMACGVTAAALAEAAEGIVGRRAIMGARMIDKPAISLNLGRAAALLTGARAATTAAASEVDQRIDSVITPTPDDQLRLMAASVMAIEQCEEAMRCILRCLGGNGLRESGSFSRRFRDIQAMPLHINAHHDRVTEQLGRRLLGLEPAPF